MGVWSSSTTECCCSPTRRTPPSTSASTSSRCSSQRGEGTPMYEKDGEQYFIVDGHTHFWNASPENRNKWGEGFIACFYDYHRNLSPEEYVWPKEKYDRYSEQDMIHDLFEIGYVDRAIMQPTYLKDFFPGGFNTIEQDAEFASHHPGKFVINGSFDPR